MQRQYSDEDESNLLPTPPPAPIFDEPRLLSAHVNRFASGLAAPSQQQQRPAAVTSQRIQSELQRRPVTWCGVALFFLAAALILTGFCEIIGAENERTHGWTETLCTITQNYAQNDSMCVYFSVETVVPLDRHHGGGGAPATAVNLCAVPASVTSQAWFHEAPACSHLDRAERHDLEYWRSVGAEHVKCLVPVPPYGSNTPVSAAQCVNAVTTAGVASIVWRTWIDRIVYLIRTPREGSAALENVLAARLGSGTLLLIVGAILLALSCALTFNSCLLPAMHAVAAQRPLLRESRARRAARERKLY